MEVTNIQASRLGPPQIFFVPDRCDHAVGRRMIWTINHPRLQNQTLDEVLTPWSIDSGFTDSTFTSPGSTEELELLTSFEQPPPQSIATGQSSTTTTTLLQQTKRPRESNEIVISNRRCDVTPFKRAASTLSLSQIERPPVLPWAKSVLVRIKPDVNLVIRDLRYTFVKLSAPDVQSCAVAICLKMGLPYISGMPISWINSKTSLWGPFDNAFLQDMPDMQDFVIEVVTLGSHGRTGLLLEM